MTDTLEWKSEKRRVADLVPASYNPRKLTDKQRVDLTASIREFGQVEPVVVNTDGTIVGGHQRISIYADLGVEEIAVRVPSRKLKKDEEKRLNLRLNKNNGEWDWGMLSEWDHGMLLGVGFSEDEMRINFGLSGAEEEMVDEERIGILMVYPPESPRLKERVGIHCDSIAQYRSIREAVESGSISSLVLEQLVAKKS